MTTFIWAGNTLTISEDAQDVAASKNDTNSLVVVRDGRQFACTLSTAPSAVVSPLERIDIAMIARIIMAILKELFPEIFGGLLSTKPVQISQAPSP